MQEFLLCFRRQFYVSECLLIISIAHIRRFAVSVEGVVLKMPIASSMYLIRFSDSFIAREKELPTTTTTIGIRTLAMRAEIAVILLQMSRGSDCAIPIIVARAHTLAADSPERSYAAVLERATPTQVRWSIRDI
jgi:hypothetical protein